MWFTKRKQSALPLPFSVKPSGQFDGNDGSWSTFLVQVGNPAQAFRAVISTSSFSTWLPTPDGCVYSQDPSFVPSNCSQLRGVGIYKGFQSSGFQESNDTGTFKYIGINSLELGNDLSIPAAFGSTYDIKGDLGLDQILLSDSASSASLTTSGGVPVYGVSNWNYFLPSLGIGIGALKSTTQNTPSFVEALVNQSAIPSRSWGYTAGASYRKYLIITTFLAGGLDDITIQKSARLPTSANWQ